MFCPNCGANNHTRQNFCRFCSLNLRETNESLVAQLSSGQNAGQLKKLERFKKLSDFVSGGLIAAIAALVLVYIYSALTGTVFSGGRIFIGLIAGFILLESSMFYLRRTHTLGYAEELERKKTLERGDVGEKRFEKRETSRLLEEKRFEAASVTENSTELLFAENKTRKLE